MKRTALVRKTPLNRGTSQLRRTPIQRTAMKPWRRKEEDKVSPEVYRAVINRDRRCQIAAYDPEHVCHNQWGDEHAADDVGQLTYEHVKKDLRAGKRAASRIELAVAACHGGNVGVPAATIRQKWRERLRLLYPAFWESPDGA